MRWSFVLPGQPPSWNHAYQQVIRQGRRGAYQSVAKTEEARVYQDSAIPIIRSARPSRWRPAGQIRVYYELVLKRDIDCDNVMKMINDAIEMATEVDDKWYLPCALTKTIGAKDPWLRVTIEDPASPYADLLGSSDFPTRS